MNFLIGSTIKEYRKKAGLTQKGLAEKIGKTESSIRKYEKDLVEIPISVIKSIADALNIEPFDLMEAEINRSINENDDYINSRAIFCNNVIKKMGLTQTVFFNVNKPYDDKEILFTGDYIKSSVPLSKYEAIQDDAVAYFSYRLLQLIEEYRQEE